MTITVQQVWEEIVRLGEANPDFVYQREGVLGEAGEPPRCKYVHDGNKPGCIVGHALMNLGVSPEKLLPCNTQPALDAMNTVGIRSLSAPHAAVIGVTQNCQDRGLPWKTAVLEGQRRLANLLAVLEDS